MWFIFVLFFVLLFFFAAPPVVNAIIAQRLPSILSWAAFTKILQKSATK